MFIFIFSWPSGENESKIKGTWAKHIGLQQLQLAVIVQIHQSMCIFKLRMQEMLWQMNIMQRSRLHNCLLICASDSYLLTYFLTWLADRKSKVQTCLSIFALRLMPGKSCCSSSSSSTLKTHHIHHVHIKTPHTHTCTQLMLMYFHHLLLLHYNRFISLTT